MPVRALRWFQPYTLLLISVFFGLGALTLTSQSLWLDEVYSLWFVNAPFTQAWAKGILPEQNPHAPLYYLMLWGWVKAAGATDFSLRFFSLGCATLAAALFSRGLRDLFDRAHAAIALALFVCSPFVFWYAQEGRQYALYLLCAVASTLCLLRILNGDRRHLWLAGFVLSAAAMAYAHFFGLFTMLAQTVALALASLAVLCLPIPFLILGSDRTFDSHDATRAFLPLPDLVGITVVQFFNRVNQNELSAAALGLTTLLAAAGLAGLLRLLITRRGIGMGLLCLALLPIGAYFAASTKIAAFTPKYLLPALPALLTGAAHTLASLRWRAARWAGLAGCVLFLSSGLARDLSTPPLQRENWRLIARYLDAHAGPDDAVLVFADYAAPVLQFYYHGPARVLPFGGDPKNPEPVFDQLQNLQPPVRHVWLVLSHDEVSVIGHRLIDVAASRYPWSFAQYPTRGAVKLLGYSMRWRHDQLPAGVPALNARFANGMELAGVSVQPLQTAPHENDGHPPSAWIHVVAYWRRWKRVAPAAKPALRLVGAAGEWGGDLERAPTVFDFDPPAGWNDQLIEAHSDVNLNPLTPPGAYPLNLRLDVPDAQPVALTDGSGALVRIATVQITR